MKSIWSLMPLLILPFLSAEVSDRAFRPDVAYGTDSRQRMDVWLAKSETPSPVVVYIHGGGWLSGTKKLRAGEKWEESKTSLLEKGISFISIDYRLNNDGNTLPTPILDAARAIQFIRSQSTKWNLDKERIAVWGGSAGGSICLWLLFHDDLADPRSTDPISRELTRVLAAVSQNGQASIDPKWITEHIGIEGAKHPMIWRAVGASSLEEAMVNYNTWKPLYQEYSPINHLDKDDPPYLGVYRKNQQIPAENISLGIHHGMFGKKLKQKSDVLGHVGYLSYSNDTPYDNEIEFIESILLQNVAQQEARTSGAPPLGTSKLKWINLASEQTIWLLQQMHTILHHFQ